MIFFLTLKVKMRCLKSKMIFCLMSKVKMHRVSPPKPWKCLKEEEVLKLRGTKLLSILYLGRKSYCLNRKSWSIILNEYGVTKMSILAVLLVSSKKNHFEHNDNEIYWWRFIWLKIKQWYWEIDSWWWIQSKEKGWYQEIDWWYLYLIWSKTRIRWRKW